jgi:hypothetical protein
MTRQERPRSPYYYGGSRKPIYSKRMKQYSFKISNEMYEWLKAQPDGMSKTVRALVKKVMDNEQK